MLLAIANVHSKLDPLFPRYTSGLALSEKQKCLQTVPKVKVSLFYNVYTNTPFVISIVPASLDI